MSKLTSVLQSALSALSLSNTPSPPPDTPLTDHSVTSSPSNPTSPPPPPPSPPPPPPGYTLACPLSTLPLNSRRCLSLNNRALLLFHLPSHSLPSPRPPHFLPSSRSLVLAIDSICYHMGGPLIEGDIEDIAGEPHIVCPWHHYRIGLTDGEGKYQVMKGVWRSKGKRQRTHPVMIVDDQVWVKVGSSADGKVESDTYGDRVITEHDVEEFEKKRKTRADYKGKGPSGLNRGTQY